MNSGEGVLYTKKGGQRKVFLEHRIGRTLPEGRGEKTRITGTHVVVYAPDADASHDRARPVATLTSPVVQGLRLTRLCGDATARELGRIVAEWGKHSSFQGRGARPSAWARPSPRPFPKPARSSTKWRPPSRKTCRGPCGRGRPRN